MDEEYKMGDAVLGRTTWKSNSRANWENYHVYGETANCTPVQSNS